MKKLFTVLLILLISDLFNAYSAYALPDRVVIKFHYKRTTPAPDVNKPNYDEYRDWNLWIWKNSDDNSKDRNEPSFQAHKGHNVNKGYYEGVWASTYVVIENTREFKDIGFLLRKSTSAGDWAERDIEVDRFINKFDRKGRAWVWLIQGDPTVYYSHPSPDKNELAQQQLRDLGLEDSFLCLDGEEGISVENPFYDPEANYGLGGWWFREKYLTKCVPVFWKISVDNDGFRKLHTMKIDPSETSGDLGNSTFNINCLNKRLNVYVPFEYANSYGFQGKGLYKIDNKKPVTFKYTQGRNLNGFFFDNPSGILNGLKIGKSEFILKVNNINGDAILKFPIADYAKAKSEFSKKSGCKLP